MIGFIIGTACLIGLVKMGRHGHCGHGGGCGGHGGWGRHGGHGGWGRHGGWAGHHGHHHGEGEGHGGPWFMRGGGANRFAMRWLFERLETSPGQEKVILEAIDEVRAAMQNARGEFRSSREDLARAVAGENFDETVIGGSFARQDDTLRTVRGAVTGALGKVHGALDENQRKRLAEIIAQGPAGGFRQWGGAPYRM